MAGERKGKTYEAIVAFVLRRLAREGELRGTVFWNVTPKGMSIEPDFTVGPSSAEPTVVILVTHSGAAGNSHMKFWRNIGELAEAKTSLRNVPRVYAVAFDSVIKDDLKRLQSAAFDGQLIVGDRPYGQALLRWVDENLGALPADAERKVEAVSALLEDGRSPVGLRLRPLLRAFMHDVRALIRCRQAALDSLWRMARTRAPGTPAVAANTFVKRGIAKLLVLPAEAQASVTKGGTAFSTSDSMDAALALGLVKRRIAREGDAPRFSVVDPEIVSLTHTLPHDTLIALLRAPLTEGARAVLGQVKNIGIVGRMLDALVREHRLLATARGMLETFERQHENPQYLFGEGGRQPTDVWVFRVAIDAIKAAGDGKQAYGYAQFVREIKALGETSELLAFVRTTCGNRKWVLPAGAEPVRRGLQDFMNRIEGRTVSRELLAVAAYVLARRLAVIGASKLESIREQLLETWKSSAFEARWLTHRGLDPVGKLIKDALAGESFREAYVPACFAEAAETLRSKLTGTTKVVAVRRTYVNWQSSHGGHTKDKKKELVGRATAIRYSWDRAKERFTPRTTIEKLILILDGTWTQEDVEALSKAGWDEILFPQQLSRLPRALV